MTPGIQGQVIEYVQSVVRSVLPQKASHITYHVQRVNISKMAILFAIVLIFLALSAQFEIL
ncbi:hypothetical protein ACH24_00050 [Francisella persica ATCC VR-331]|uniref:Uncharacterized protein n=1 Tax=Francisella persica ATCC VR-331 TaxID=1086726 RepID=A0AAC8VCU3_9GAMM|nr:hypothetical protein ACH24_00050 [Francisella persica ATCC VR-331]ANH77530.1 hypothetical protein FSC845_02885 [Francisella persica ATCC VR-331]